MNCVPAICADPGGGGRSEISDIRKRIRSPTPVIIALLLVAVLLALRDSSDLPSSTEHSHPEETVLVEHVIDGDTVVVNDGRRIRLLAIDAPEMVDSNGNEERGARAATEWMRAQVEGKTVVLRSGPEREDRYGRQLAWIYLPSGELINRECLLAGHARLLTQFGLPEDLGPSLYRAEATARIKKTGLWGRE